MTITIKAKGRSPIVDHSFTVLLALVLSLLLTMLLIVLIGQNPLIALASLWEGAFGNAYSIGTTFNKAVPLILAGLSVAVGVKSGFFNIGAEGQICVGGLAATWAALTLPGWLALPGAIVAGALAGGVWMLVPAFLKIKRGVSEVITTLLMNYVGLYLLSYFVHGPLREPAAAGTISLPQSPAIPEYARLPLLLPGASRLHGGIILALVLVAVVWLIMQRTTWGYRLRMVGLNPNCTSYLGLNTKAIILSGMLLSGALAGLAGASEILGAQYRLRDAFLPNYGYDAIAVALLAQSNPLAVLFSATFFASLRSGAGMLQRTVGLSSSLVFIIQAIPIIFIACAAGKELLKYFLPAKKGKVIKNEPTADI
ncbi:MAG: ABC transporter permease [Clostridia bacterium]|nr:ABC transporter permease [Clostridia bacterium]